MVSCYAEDSLELPDKIIDLGSLTIAIDNRGIAKLSITVLTKGLGIIYGICAIDIDSNGTVFHGTIVEDSPSELLGTVYYEHHLAAIGMIQ